MATVGFKRLKLRTNRQTAMSIHATENKGRLKLAVGEPTTNILSVVNTRLVEFAIVYAVIMLTRYLQRFSFFLHFLFVVRYMLLPKKMSAHRRRPTQKSGGGHGEILVPSPI